MKTIILLSLFYVLSTALLAQSISYSQKVAPAILKRDFLILRDTLQKVHPALYRFKSKAAIDQLFDSCLATIRDSMTVPEFYTLTSFAIAAIGDGHANSRLPRQLMTAFMANEKLFPAMVLFINKHAFIYCCKQNEALAGTELVSINGRSMDEIITHLFQYIPTDGNILSRKNWELPEYFHLLYTLVYGPATQFDISYKTQKGQIKTATLPGDFMKNSLCPSPFKRPDRYLQLRYTTDHMAILTISTFFDDFLKQTGENFTHFLDSAFTDLKAKHITKLVIDGRRNQGGYDHNGEILYAFLTQKPFRYYATQESATEKFTESQNHDLGLQTPKEPNYTGKVYFLMDGRSFSGTAEFSAIARSNNRGLFIGEEVGGGYYGNSSGSEAMVTLPATQISCRIPLIKYTMAVKKVKYPDRGVIPDYPVYPTITDFIEHTDSQMDYTLQLARKQ